MQLDEAQRQKVTSWVTDGLRLSEIQTRLASELGIRLTYMEVRFLVDDLKLTLKDPEPSPADRVIGGESKGALRGQGLRQRLLAEQLARVGAR